MHFGALDPEAAREIFIRDALVGGEFDTRAPFFAHNQKLVREIRQLEHKTRRLDVLVDDELIYAFYDQLLPADVCTGAQFEKWRAAAGESNAEAAVPVARRADAARGRRRDHRSVPEVDDDARRRRWR